MVERLQALLQRVIDWWNKFTAKQKTAIISITAGVILALAILGTVLTRTKFATLITCETTKTASQIVDLLESNSIEYKTSDDGLIISVPEEWREKMFQETKRHFIQENGVANGDTTRRTEVFTAYQKSTPIDKRLNGTWTLGQYERNYRQAFYDAVKKADPKWELGKPFNSSILDKISREDIDNSLVKASGEYGGTNLVSKGIDIKL